MAKKITKKNAPKTTKKVETSEKQYSEVIKNDNELKDTSTIGDNLNEDKIVTEKMDLVEQDPPLETISVETSMTNPIDEIGEEAMAETFNENKKKRLIDNMIGYSWNGQEIDYIL